MNARLDLPPNGCFIAAPQTVGATIEEIESAARNELLPERHQAIVFNLRAACNQLMYAVPAGRC